MPGVQSKLLDNEENFQHFLLFYAKKLSLQNLQIIWTLLQ